jgi:Fe-S-cluster containining protein
VTIDTFGEPMEFVAEIPDGRAKLADVVPLAHAICDRIVSASIAHHQANGRTTHCAKGCDGCCRSELLGLAPVEVFHLLGRIPSLPSDLRGRLTQTLDAATRAIEQTGLLTALRCARTDQVDHAEVGRLITEWWRGYGFACPFLDDGACGIYEHRFTVCRELVSLSPPDTCEELATERMDLPVSVLVALNEFGAEFGLDSAAVVIFPMITLWANGKIGLAKRTWRAVDLVGKLFAALQRAATPAEAA